MTEPKPKKRLTPTEIYIHVAALIALPLALVALLPSLYAVYRVWQVADDAQAIAIQNRAATCSFLEDLRERYNATEIYLKAIDRREIPPPPGVDLAAVKITQSSRKGTLDSFKTLDCKGGEGK